ncbi:MAG: DNA-binding response regulator, partial [Actinomycetales bacterium]
MVVDDDPLVRTGLGFILGADPEIELVAEGTDGDEVIPLINKYQPDVVLLD